MIAIYFKNHSRFGPPNICIHYAKIHLNLTFHCLRITHLSFVVNAVGEMKGGKAGVQKTKMDHHHHPVKFV